MLPCSTLAAAVRQKDWEEARRQLILLHERGAGALESHIYVGAAVESLTSTELETDAERLEWFIHWYSLVPPFAGEEKAYWTSLFAQQNTRLCEVLLQFETHLEHLTRIVVLFGEKRYGAFFAERLLPHIVQFGPPEKAMDVLEAVALASGWSTSNPDRNALAATVIDTLLQSGHFHEAVAALARVRTTYASVQETVAGKRSSRPPVPQHIYGSILRQIYFFWGDSHPYYQALTQWENEDYLGGSFSQPKRTESVPPSVRKESPSPEELPKAIRELFLPNARVNATTLSFILHTIYLLQPPRYNLLGLIHRRVSGITQISTVPGHETIWIRAEMLRLIRGGDPEEALRLYASRYLWIGLPTGPRWDEWRKLQTSTQEDVGLGEDVVGNALPGIRRKQVPQPGMISVALHAIAHMDGGEQTLLAEDYVSFLENCETRDPTRSSPSQDPSPRFAFPGMSSFSPSTPHHSIESPLTVNIPDPSFTQLASTEPNSLAELPSSQPDLSLSTTTTSPSVPITPWTAPPTPFYLPPPLLPTRSSFNVWIRAFAPKHPGQAMSILKDMVDRKIHTDSYDWALVLEGFLKNNHPELAISGLQTLEKEGGIEIDMPPLRVDNRSLLGPIEPLLEGQDEHDLPLGTTGELTRIQLVRPRLKVVPPANSDVYVRLIKAAQNVGETEISRLFEEMMANAKVVLTDWNKEEMQVVYRRRGWTLQHAEWDRGAQGKIEFEVSPWGEPGKVFNPTGPDGKFLPHTAWGVSGWGRTSMDDGEPIQSRLKKILPSQGKANWERRMRSEVQKEKTMVEQWRKERAVMEPVGEEELKGMEESKVLGLA